MELSSPEFDYLFKRLFIRDSGVRKNCLLFSFTSYAFEDLSPTIGNPNPATLNTAKNGIIASTQLARLMGTLIHSGFFVKTKLISDTKGCEGYALAPPSILLKDNPLSVIHFLPVRVTFPSCPMQVEASSVGSRKCRLGGAHDKMSEKQQVIKMPTFIYQDYKIHGCFD
nr:Ras-related protein RABC1 [Ipomoea batatas]